MYRIVLSIGRVIRGGFWLTLGLLLSNFFGFVYWLVVSALVPPEVVGRVAAILGVEGLTLAMLNLGIPVGIQRFLGKHYGAGDLQSLSRYHCTALVFLMLVSVCAGLAFLVMAFSGIGFASLDPDMLFFTGALIIIGLNGWPLLGAAFFNSILKTEYITVVSLLTGIVRLSVGIVLVYLGLGFLGVVSGYLAAALATSILMLVLPLRALRQLAGRLVVDFSVLGEVVRAGIFSWIPSLSRLAGQWLGVLGVYGFIGTFETGVYFIAYTITLAIFGLSTSVLQLMFPTLSGMADGRKRAMSRVVRLTTTITYPIIFVLILYPWVIPSFLGDKYLPASPLIQIMAMGYILQPIILGYTYYAYAAGKYFDVMAVGLAENIPRLVLYALLGAFFKDTGVAMAFSLGSLSALISVIPLSKRSGFVFNRSELLKTASIPAGMAFAMRLLSPHWLIGTITIVMTSFFLYIKLRIITKEDLRELAKAFLPDATINRVYRYSRPILWLLFGE
ncbi:MAG: oligosaccharide flippase family protein [Thermosphaera sp.]